jgi:MFS family permease
MCAVLSPGLSHVGDSFGRRYIVLGGVAFGVVGAFVIASAKTMEIALLGSCLYGVMFSVQVN